ncbi:transforming growth factor beta regulator 1-like [Tubulanus polymorphus]|uniref:transforming growth factor beta regulator 1-like n=1 Tax=Tubulanus polymorphus TaxID=672921 RepID=UPI003DA4DE85
MFSPAADEDKAKALSSASTGTGSAGTLTGSGNRFTIIALSPLLEAAYKILEEANKPLHVQEIKCKMLETTTLDVQTISQLDKAITRDIQVGAKRFKQEEGNPGVFMLVQTTSDDTVKPKVTGVSPNSDFYSIAARHQQQAVKLHQMKQEKIYRKYKRLRKQIKQMVFLNSALCDEVSGKEEKLDRLRNERRFLLRRVLQHEAAASRVTPEKPTAVTPHAAMLKKFVASLTAGKTESVKDKVVKKRPSLATTATRKIAKHLLAENMKAKARRTSSKTVSSVMKKNQVQPIPLDLSGRPIFPILLGGLTVHSLGEVVSDRSNFHTQDYIFPVGFCSTREYSSTTRLNKKCLYTCKISDAGSSPKFEISSDDNPLQMITGSSAFECHKRLLESVNKLIGSNILVPTKGKGAEFFGFSQPTIQNLIQSSLGARKCSNYKWVKYEVCRLEPGEVASVSENDIGLSFEALQSHPAYQQGVAASMSAFSDGNLRSLLVNPTLQQSGDTI